jgi:hypothetical protein
MLCLCYIALLSVERRLEVMPEPSPRIRRDARRMCLAPSSNPSRPRRRSRPFFGWLVQARMGEE